MRCYNGCPDSELKAYWDNIAKCKQEIIDLGYTVTYFPMEGKYMAFKNYRPASQFHGSLASLLATLKGGDS